MTDDREQGLDFGAVEPALESESYPLSNDEVLAKYGDREIEYADGAATVSSLLEPFEGQTYESAEAVRQAMLDMVGEDAVGRTGYSDRGTETTNEESDQESF